MNVSTQPVWAEEKFERNKVRQLLVPGGELEVTEKAGVLRVSSVYGSWPARRTAAEVDALTAVLPRQSGRDVRWRGGRAAHAPQTVVESYREAIGYGCRSNEGAVDQGVGMTWSR